MRKRVLLLLVVAMSALQAMALSTTNFESNNYVWAWGRLKLVTTSNSGENKVQLADKNGKAVQLRGWATHGYQWHSAFFNAKDDFEAMKRLGANVVRLTCYVSTAENGMNATWWRNTKTWVQNAITWCEELGLYAIVDYHVLKPGSPTLYLRDTKDSSILESAEDFFTDISAFVKENNYHHVLYEICNEPNNANNPAGTPNPLWPVIKSYAEKILPIIAENDPNAVVIVGTPQWSQQLTSVLNNKLTHATLQIMYTFHYYACSHLNVMNQNFSNNVLRQIPVIVTEWNDTQASGEGSCGTPPSSNATTFINRCNNEQQRVSWTAWSWSPVTGSGTTERTSSTWIRGTNGSAAQYTLERLSPTGLMIYNELQQNHINYTTSVESTASASFSIYPNPAKNGNFNIKLPSNETSVLTITNQQGQTVYSTVIANGFASINTELGASVYIVSVRSESGLKTQKLVIK